MQFAKRMLTALTALLLGFTFALSPAALAEESSAPELEISVSLSPENPSAPVEILLTFTLVNQSDEELRELRLTFADGQIAECADVLAASESATVSQPYALTQAELDAGVVSCIATCETDSGRHSYPVDIELSKTDSQPNVEFRRQFSNRSVTDGGSIAIVYQVTNAGSIPVTALTVEDALGDFSAALDSLEPGASKSFIQYVSPSEDAVSSPTLRYNAGASQQDAYTLRLDDAAITVARSLLDASLTAGRSMFNPDSAEVILRLTNGGSVDYLNLTIYDDIYGGIIADSIRLPAGGEAVEVAHSYPLRGDGTYRWRVTGENAAGDAIDFITDTLTVPDEGGNDVLLLLSAEAAMTRISRGGYVPVTLSVSNIGSEIASNVLIREESLGDLGELAVVPTGDPTEFHVRLDVRQNATYVFSASYVDPLGQLRVATADPVEITIGAGGQAPERDEPAGSMFDGLPRQLGNSQLFVVLLVGSCVVLIALIVILLITSRRARKQRKVRAAARKQRLKEELGKTAQFKPIKRGRK